MTQTPFEAIRKDVIDHLPQQPFKAIVKAVNLVAGTVQLQVAGSSSWQWVRCTENVNLNRVSIGQEAVVAIFGGEPIVVGFVIRGKQYEVPAHDHTKDAQGGLLNWDIWEYWPIHGHRDDEGGGTLFVGVSVYNSANIVIPTGVWTALTFNTERRDDAAFHSLVTNTSRLTVPTGYEGWYVIAGSASFAASAAGTRRLIAIYQNGVAITASRFDDFSAAAWTQMSISTVYYFSEADYIQLYVYQDTGGNLNTNASSNDSPEFRMVRIA